MADCTAAAAGAAGDMMRPSREGSLVASTTPSFDETPAEFTLRALLAGLIFGLLFGAANAYLGLRVGLTVSTSIPIAVLTVAAFRFSGGRGILLEANIAQTIGSASSSLASGTIFTIPALFMWGFVPPLTQVALLALMGGWLGIAAMVPLRRLLIVRGADELPYPEGTACAQVLRATTARGGGGRWIFLGLLIGAGVKIAIGAASLIASDLQLTLPVIPKAELALELAPALFGVGYILGYRQSAIMVAGSLVSWVVLIPLIALVGDGLTAPLFPEATRTINQLSASQIWGRYVRYIGAGAVAAAGIVTVFRSLPTMYRSLAAVIAGLRRQEAGARTEAVPRTDRDVPPWVVLAVPALVVITLFSVPGLLAGDMGPAPRLVASLGVAVFGVAFVVVSSRIVGLIGVSSNPTSGMALVTLLGVAVVFVACGWTDPSARAAILTVGTVVCVAASKAGDISQDLKTGQLLGATPARQQLGQFIGAAFACWGVAATVLVLGKAYTFGSAALPAPQATLMKTVIEGVLAGALPWGLVGTGAAFSLSAMLAGLPGLAFAVGIYLPLGSLTPIFVGGLVRRIVDARREGAAAESDPGVLASSGMIAGEGLAGVMIAFLLGYQNLYPGQAFSAFLKGIRFGDESVARIAGPAGIALGLALVTGLCLFLYRAGRAAEPEPAA
jgi:putative OPT family oligopeptide transporter